MHEEMSLWGEKQRKLIVIDILTITKSSVHLTDIWAQTIFNNKCNHYNIEHKKIQVLLENLFEQLGSVY